MIYPSWVRQLRLIRRMRQIRIREVADQAAVRDVPQLDEPVARAGHDLLAVRTPCHAEDALAVTFRRGLFVESLDLFDQAAARGIPNFDTAIETAGRDLLAVGTPGDAVDGGRLGLGVGVDLFEE